MLKITEWEGWEVFVRIKSPFMHPYPSSPSHPVKKKGCEKSVRFEFTFSTAFKDLEKSCEFYFAVASTCVFGVSVGFSSSAVFSSVILRKRLLNPKTDIIHRTTIPIAIGAIIGTNW